MKKRALVKLFILSVLMTSFVTNQLFSKTVSLTSGKNNKLFPVTSELNSDRNINETLVIWFEESNNGTLYAQKLNSNGDIEWGNSGKILLNSTGIASDFPIIHPDQIGGAVIIFTAEYQLRKYVKAIKINSNGNIIGRPIIISGYLPGNNSNPASVVTEHEVIVITWENEKNDEYDIYAQAIDYNLHKIWNDEQPAKVCDYEYDQRRPTLATDGLGGVFITWLDNRNTYENLLNYSLDIYASRLDHDGTPYFNGHKGNLILSNSLNSIADNNGFQTPRKEVFYNHDLITSVNNSFILASDMFRGGRNFVQLVKVNKYLELVSEKIIMGKERTGDIRIYSDGNFGVNAVWKDYSNNLNLIMSSAFDKDLNTFYPENGLIISCEQMKGNNDRVLPDIRIKNSMIFNMNTLYINWTNTDDNRLFISNMNLTDESDLCNNTTEILGSIDDGEYTSFTTQADNLVIVYKNFNNIFAHIRELNEATTTERTDGYRLGNFPNPFNPTTSINFFIPKSGFVSLKVYDITGKEVRTVLNEFRTNGEHTVTFSAQDLSSGAYFYRLDADGIVITRRMTILK